MNKSNCTGIVNSEKPYFCSMNRILVIFYCICINLCVGFCQTGDSLIAGIANSISVSLPKERNYPKYTLQSAGNGKVTEIKEVYDSARAEKVLFANVTPSCNCTSFIVNILGINKKGGQEKIGSMEYAVKKYKVNYPEWWVAYTPHNETVEKQDTLPIEKNTLIASLGTKHNIALLLPIYTKYNPLNISLNCEVKIYQKVGMADYRYIGNNRNNMAFIRLFRNNSISPYYLVNLSSVTFHLEKTAMNYILYEIQLSGDAISVPCDPEKDPKKRALYNTNRYKFAIGFIPNSKPSIMPPKNTRPKK